MPSPSILCIQIAGARRWRRSARRRSDQARGKETNEKGEKLTVWFCGTKRRVDVDRTSRASADDDEAKTIMDWRTQSESRCSGGRSAGERAGTWYRRDTGGWYRFWFYCGNAERSRQLVSPPAGETSWRAGARRQTSAKAKRRKEEKGGKGRKTSGRQRLARGSRWQSRYLDHGG